MRSFFIILSLILAASARPSVNRRASFTLKNGQDAIALNENFKSLNANSPCQSGEDACIDQKFAQCSNGKFVIQACGPGTICSALPLTNSPGTSITCTTEADVTDRIAATGAQSAGGNTDKGSGANNAGAGGAAGSGGNFTNINTGADNAKAGSSTGNNDKNDAQKSLSMSPSTVGGSNTLLTRKFSFGSRGHRRRFCSTNNFINFCKTVNLPITNGKQIAEGSCNPAPMGAIASTSAMPSSKFVFPKNGGNVVIEKLDSLTQTKPNNPNKFEFFKGVNGKADAQGILSVEVDKGLPAGTYKLSSINAAANHQPVLVAVAQHGSTTPVYCQMMSFAT